jgi:hypothetical protein
MAVSADSDRLDQFEEGNTAGGYAGDVEAIPYPAVSPSMTFRRVPRPEVQRGMSALGSNDHVMQHTQEKAPRDGGGLVVYLGSEAPFDGRLNSDLTYGLGKSAADLSVEL